MSIKEEINKLYRDHINSNTEENRKGALALKDAIEHSPLNFNGIIDKTVHIPKIFDEEDIKAFKEISRVTYGIFKKVIEEYRSHADFRSLFPFPKELEELILLPSRYDGTLPIARFDIFYDEETRDFDFCEINTDGTAAMIRDLEIRKALICNPAHQQVIRSYELEPFELFDSWVSTFMELYGSYGKKKDDPAVAIVDFLENATLKEFEEFARAFQKAGLRCEICDIRTLKYRDGALYSKNGNRIDAVYRRAVTADIMDHLSEVGDFLSAVKDDAVFIAGSFATQIIHTKWLFYVLHHERCRSFLSEEELKFIKEHVPKTVELSEKYISLEEVQSDKDGYMIKPMDAYASKGIYAAGHEYTQADWDALTRDLYGKGYICQRYCRQYLTDNIDLAWGDGTWHPYINMPGLYTYEGVFKGILMRMACDEKIIVAHENERTAPVFLIKGKR